MKRNSKRLKVLVMFLLFALILPNPLVQAVTKPVVGVSTVYTEKVGTIQVGVFIASDSKIASGSFELEYDEKLLRIRNQDLTIGETISPALTSTNGAKAGTVSVSWAQASEQTLNGTLLTVSAYMLKAGETANISLKNVKLYSGNGTPIDIQLLDGAVKPFKGETKVHNKKEQPNKEWTVTLNKEFNPSTLNKHTVVVKNSRGALVEVKVKKKTNNSFTVTPISNYGAGKYTLEISEQVRSINGSKLNKAIKHEFTIQ